MKLVLVRHGEPHPELAVAGDTGGVNPALTERGLRQAELVGAALSERHDGQITAIVSSPLRRAAQTAEPLSRLIGLPILIDERLRELDEGSTEYGKGFEQYPSRAAVWNDLNHGRWGSHLFDPEAFLARVVAGMDAAIAENGAGIVAVFCHAGVVGAYLSQVVHSDRTFFFAPDYTGITTVVAESDGYRELIAANDTSHLRQPSR